MYIYTHVLCMCQVKKRGATELHWDVSYKEAKHLCKLHGESLFKGLVTATNEYGDIRLQFHIVTDAHDQMDEPIKAFLATCHAYNLPIPRWVFTDKPSTDKGYFMRLLPGVREMQSQLNTKSGTGVRSNSNGLPMCRLDESLYRVYENTRKINEVAQSIRSTVTAFPPADKILGLDAEWDVPVAGGSRGKIALIQIAWRENDVSRAALFRVHSKSELPRELKALFTDPALTFTGKSVEEDLKKIAEDFNCVKAMRSTPFVDLAHMARDRDVVKDARVGLQELTRLTVCQHLEKPDEIRRGKWSGNQLTPEQMEYAAIDATISLDVYHHLKKLPDMTRRLNSNEATVGRIVDIVPSTGGLNVMSTRIGVAVIEDSSSCVDGWQVPLPNSTVQKLSVGDSRRLVTIQKIYATHAAVPLFKVKRGDSPDSNPVPVPLNDFIGQKIVLPLRMLAPHVPEDNVRVTQSMDTDGDASTSVGIQQEDGQPGSSDRSGATGCVYSGKGKERMDDTEVETNGGFRSIFSRSGDAEEEPDFDDEEEDAELDSIKMYRHLRDSYLSNFNHPKLDPAPDTIEDCYSSVLGDGFHFMDRYKSSL